MSNSKSFIYQLQYFSDRFSVYAPDMKGFGDNAGMEKPYSLSDYAVDIINYCKENNIIHPHVVAHSFGARVAIKIASENPNFFDKIVLTGGAGLKPKRGIKYYAKKLAFKIGKLFLKREKLYKFYSKDYLALSPVMRKSFIKIVNERLDKQVEKITNPTLIINGDKDSETPPYTARRFHKKIKNSKLIFIKGASHFAFVDDPVKFNWEVKEFLLR